MSNQYGKTRRKVSHLSHENDSLFVYSDTPLEILGNTLTSNVQYSVNKGKRWEILPMISNHILSEKESDSFENESMRCYISQKSYSRRSERGIYLIDSDCKKEIGNYKMSKLKMNKGSFNLESVIKNWEQDMKISNKENSLSEESFNKQEIIENVLDQKFTSKESFKNTLNNELSKKKNQSLDDSCVKNKIIINEVISINNPYHQSFNFHPERWKKTKRKEFVEDLNDAIEDYEYDDNDDDNYSNEVENQCDFMVSNFRTQKPFTLSENIFSFNTDLKGSKKKTKRKHKGKSLAKKEFIKPDRKIIKNRSNFKADNIPFININLPVELFLTELKSISDFCRCWSSKTSQKLILINLDYVENVDEKNFIILKPVALNDNKEISLKVILNLWNYDQSKLHDNNFLTLTDLVTFIQLTIDEAKMNKRPNQVSKILKVTKPIINLFNTWDTEIVQESNSIFYLNEEWENFEFQLNNIDFDTISDFQFNLMSCEICHENQLISDLIMMSACQHLICERCLSNNLINLIMSQQFGLTCPVVNCQSKLDCVSILSVIPFRQYEIRKDQLERESIKNRGCKCKFCNSCLIKTDIITTKQFDYLCKCENIICGICGNRQHWPASCDGIENHDKQLKKINDNSISLKNKSLTVKGKFCLKCNSFHTNNNSYYEHIYCSCFSWFCYNCGKSSWGESHTLCTSDKLQMKFEIQLKTPGCIPEPDSFRPKFYCNSVNIRFLQQPLNISSLKRMLLKIDNNIQEDINITINRKDLFIQYKQILQIIECLYISQYQSKRNSQSNSSLLIKFSQNLMFYIHQFQSLIEQLNMAVMKKSTTQFSKLEVMKKRELVDIYIKDAMNVVAKFKIFIR